ncbi:PREDICTED: uncharacterized protein LOC104811936 [Tarenaya hassleriana]|uniref:uncharacterized protein LOC104811936 n=1 Tax=Tarenaya hassleriana TaxID=28532 RepID=UPI00053C3ECF|nr:PREDICTED: uncharacterized protein LOC104811936 [Tarenaya hassleriana]
MEMEGLSVICADLGFFEIDGSGKRIGYLKSDYCLDNLKDLLRFLRRDDPQTREVFKQVCAWNTVSEHLIPIIEQYPDDRNLVLNAVKVLVFLTMPIEPSSSDIPRQIEFLWGLKSAITYSKIVAVIVTLLENPLENLELNSLTEEDWKLVQLVLTLFRNLLAIHDISSLQKAGESACHLLSLRDRFLELLFSENVMDVFIVITQTIDGSSSLLRHDNLLLLEIFHYIFIGQDPELITEAPEKEGEAKKTSADSLKTLMEEEQVKSKLRRLHNMSRHSQFSGTFTRVAVDGSKAVLKGIPSTTDSTVLKPTLGRGAAEKIVWEHGRISLAKDSILKLLHDFINQFMTGGYNVLMQSILDDIEKEHHSIQSSDIVVFFQVAQFITSFQCCKSLASKPATGKKETSELSANENAEGNFSKSDICGPIAATINEQMFSLVISKWRYAFEGLKETNDFKFLSAAGSLVRTMLCMLDLVTKLLPDDSREAFTVRILLYKLFYDQTDQGMCQFILNLVKTFDKHKQPKSDLADLVESIHVIVGLMENLQGGGTLRVSKKSRKARKKRTMGDKKDTVHEENHPGSSNEASMENGDQMAVLAVSTKDGPINVSTLEIENSDKPSSNHVVDDLTCGTDDSSDDEEPTAKDEVDFKVSTFISAFASSSIIQNLCWLLKFYKNNSKQTNHHIVSMLRRITEDLELSPMLYQLSLLIIFYKILDEQRACPCKDYEDIVTFLTDLVRKMLKKMKTQPLLFVEILFWKTRKECHYINAEYLLHELGHMRKQKGNQENVSGNAENSSPQGWAHRSIADALGDDEADVAIYHDLGFQNEEDVENESAGPSQRKRRLVLDDETETKIKELYDKFKDAKNCSQLIAQSLDPDGRVSAAQITNKLKQLGLLARKRIRHSKSSLEETQAKNGNDDSNQVEATSFDQPSNTRKRVSSFSKEQETLIKELYEKFKDQRRCCYLIANALGSENTSTTAQISRKLKQLGLRLPRQKKAKGDMVLRDEDHDDNSSERTDGSDNETLQALRNRMNRRSQKSGKLAGSDEISREDGTEMERARDTEEEINHDPWENKGNQKDAPSSSSPEDLNHRVDGDGDGGGGDDDDDEFADYDGDIAPNVSLTQSPLSRRKLKMVVDDDDDD